MLKITGVNTLDDGYLDIMLESGSQILFNLGPLINTNPVFEPLRGLPVLPRPETDGDSIFWPGGPRLGLRDIMAMLEPRQSGEAL